MNANEHPAPFWSLAFHFDDWETAGRAYERSRDEIFARDVDAGCYRVLLTAKAYVVIVGFGVPLPSLIERLAEMCQQGESTEVPDEVVLTLALRHEQYRHTPGLKFERRGSL